MSAPLLHIVQTELSEARTGHFLEALGETDVIVLLHKQASLLKGLRAATCGAVYTIYDAELEPVHAVAHAQAINHARFVEVIAHCAQSRTW